MDRRRFLEGAALLVSQLAIASSVACSKTEKDAIDPLASLIEVFPAQAIELGKKLQIRGDPEKLLRTLIGQSSISNPRAAGKWIRNTTLRDFRTGRVTEIEGWYLSRTEALICAVASQRM